MHAPPLMTRLPRSASLSLSAHTKECHTKETRESASQLRGKENTHTHTICYLYMWEKPLPFFSLCEIASCKKKETDTKEAARACFAISKPKPSAAAEQSTSRWMDGWMDGEANLALLHIMTQISSCCRLEETFTSAYRRCFISCSTCSPP